MERAGRYKVIWGSGIVTEERRDLRYRRNESNNDSTNGSSQI